MRSKSVIAALVLSLTLASSAQTYEEFQTRAGELLKQHEGEKAAGLKTSWSEKDKAFQAGDMWMEAAKLAPSDLQKFNAYRHAGAAYSLSQSQRDEALQAYTKARDITSMSDSDRAEVGLEVARRSHKRDDYKIVTTLGKATPEQKAMAFRAIGNSFITEAHNAPKLNIEIVENYILSSAQFATFDPTQADTTLGIASVKALSVPDPREAVNLLDRVNKARLALPIPDSTEYREGRIKIQWADSLLKLKEADKAIALWNSVGSNSKYSLEQREEALVKAADCYKTQKKPDSALQALDSASKLRSENFVFSEKIAEKQIAIFDETDRPTEALAVLAKLVTHPKVGAQRQEHLRLDQAKRLYDLKRAKEANEILAHILAHPTRANLTIQLVVTAQAQHYSDIDDLKQARKTVDSGLSRLAEAHADPEWRKLSIVSGNLYQRQKDYLAAFEAYSDACRTYNGRHQPSQELVNLTDRALKLAIQENKLDQAQAITEKFAQTWQVHPIISSLFQAQLKVAQKDFGAAGQAITQAKSYLPGISGDQLKVLEARITELENALPK